MPSFDYKRILNDIRFWILIFLLIRLIGITNPPIETGHNWRQTTVTMVARNFVEVDNNILYPRIDIAGEKTGITGMEFPILNYLIYLFSELFGYDHWYGRLINLLVSSVGIWFFYKLVERYFNRKTALYAGIILLASIWFQFSRKIMPDTFSMSLVIASIYFGTNYLEARGGRSYLNLLGYLLLMCLGVLSKLPSGFILAIFALFIFDKRIPLQRKLIFSVVSVIGLIPAIWWYYKWVPHLVETYGFWHFFMGKSFAQGFSEIANNLDLTLHRFYDTALKYSGFLAFVIGLILAFTNRNKTLLWVFGLGLTSFSVIMFKAGFTFYHHNYYMVPFAPLMALVAAYGLSRFKFNKLAPIFLALIAIEGVAAQVHDLSLNEKQKALLALEEDLDQVSDRDDLILINSGDYPTLMYFAHRRGWVEKNHEIRTQGYIDSLKKLGLEYIVVLNEELSYPEYEILISKKYYQIFAVD